MTAVEKYLEARRSAKRVKVANHPKPPEITWDFPLVERRGGARQARFNHFYPLELMPEPRYEITSDTLQYASFWVKGESRCTAGALTKFARRTGWKFKSRAQAEDGTSNSKVGKAKRGLRVWRVK